VSSGKTVGELGKSLLLELLGNLSGADGLGRSNGGGWTAAWDLARVATRATLGGLLAGLGGAGGHVEDVEVTASGGFLSELLAGVVADLIAIKHVVEPVAAAWLHQVGLEAEGTPPLGGARVTRQRKLTLIAIPRSDKVDLFNVGGGAERETELNC